MIELEINDSDVHAALDRVAGALTDLSPVMQEIGENMVRSTQDRMAQGQQPDGTPFAPRSPVTLARYTHEGKNPGPYPLWLTATMRQNIAFVASSDHVQWGSNAIQAAVMQFGAAQGEFGARMGRTRPTEKQPQSRDYFFHLPWGNIPARPFLGLSESDRADIVEMIDKWLEAAVAS